MSGQNIRVMGWLRLVAACALIQPLVSQAGGYSLF